MAKFTKGSQRTKAAARKGGRTRPKRRRKSRRS